MKNEKRFRCPYCRAEVTTVWEKGKKPICSNCGARLYEVSTEDGTSFLQGEQKKRAVSLRRITGSVFSGIACLVLIILLFGIIRKSPSDGAKEPIPDARTVSGFNKEQNGIYVKEIGRTCIWLPSVKSYYDAKTDCYFLYNDTMAEPTWQYFYEEISTNYGDYGWMEYDEEKETWFIEKEDGNWIELPKEYVSDRLWHIGDQALEERQTDDRRMKSDETKKKY